MSKPSARHAGSRARALAAVIAALVLVASGCAYFNTFYNAKKLFGRAEEAQRAQGQNAGAADYQACIDKCLLLLKYYPNSKYADDALFLIGMSRLQRSEFVQARASFEDLMDRFPNTEFAERAYYNMGIASLYQGDPAGSEQAFEILRKRFPDSSLNVEAVFRTAESRLDTKNFESARADLRAFIRDHPKSRLVADAQLRVARTYYEESRYEDARREYDLVLKEKISHEVRFEAELNSALALRAQAEQILSDPAVQGSSPDASWRAAPVTTPVAPPAHADGEVAAPAPFLGPARHRTLPRVRLPSSAAPDTTADPGDDMPPGDDAAADSTFPPSPDSNAGLNPRTAPASNGADPLAHADEEGTGVAPGDSSRLSEGAMADFTTPVPEDSAHAAAHAAARQQAQAMLADSAARLEALRKTAAKLGRQLDLRIELAVTRGLRGQPDEAISDLDQIARLQPRSDQSVQAFYQIGEIHRRRRSYEKARAAYESAQREKPEWPLALVSQRKSAAIVARAASAEKLRGASEILRRWRETQAQQGQKAPHVATPAPAARGKSSRDSVESAVALQSKFEQMASELVHVAEIDLLDLEQPLLALREFEQVLRDYSGSLQSARAAFAVAWIYDHRLRDTERARQAYAQVVRDYPDTPQGQEASAILAAPPQQAANPEVKGASSQP